MSFCFEIDPGTYGVLTTNTSDPLNNAILGVKAHNNATATWKYRTAGSTSWPASFYLCWLEAINWSSWTGNPFDTSNVPFSTDTVAITLGPGDQLFSATVIGGGLVYLKRKSAVNFVFYTNVAGNYLPNQTYSFSTATVPSGTWRYGEDKLSLAQKRSQTK